MTAAHDTQRRILESLNAQLVLKVNDLTHIHREIQTALETWQSWPDGPLMPLLGDSGGNEDDVDGQMAAFISDLTGIEAFSNLKPLVWAEELDETVAELPGPRNEMTFWFFMLLPLFSFFTLQLFWQFCL